MIIDSFIVDDDQNEDIEDKQTLLSTLQKLKENCEKSYSIYQTFSQEPDNIQTSFRKEYLKFISQLSNYLTKFDLNDFDY